MVLSALCKELYDVAKPVLENVTGFVYSIFAYSKSSTALYGARNPLHTHSLLAVTSLVVLILWKTAQAKQVAIAAVSRTPPMKPPPTAPTPTPTQEQGQATEGDTQGQHAAIHIHIVTCSHGAATNSLFLTL